MAFDIPKKKDWTPGISQVGWFWRTPQGSTLTLVKDKASEEDVAIMNLLILGAENLPAKLRQELVQHWHAVTEKAEKKKKNGKAAGHPAPPAPPAGGALRGGSKQRARRG